MCKRRLSLTFSSLQLETLRAYKIEFFGPTGLKLASLIRKLYVDIKNGLNLENSITNKSVCRPFTKLCKQRLSLFLSIIMIVCKPIFQFLFFMRNMLHSLMKAKFKKLQF